MAGRIPADRSRAVLPTMLGAYAVLPLVLAVPLAAALPARPPVHTIASPIGHDGFLTEYGQVADTLKRTLAL